MTQSDRSEPPIVRDLQYFDDTPVDGEYQEIGCEVSAKTVASSPQCWRYENGRRYHSYRDGAYWGPNDEADSYHQTVTHHLYCLTLQDKLFLAPISDPQNVLDLGTGRGLWAMDFADQFPKSNVIGTDLSPVWENTVQPNLRFEVDDFCSEWTYPPDTRERFEYIHIRGLYGSVGDWAKLYKDCYDHLTPGGYIEQAEAGISPRCDDGTLPPDSIFYTWEKFARDSARAMKKPLDVTETMKQNIEAAGFVDVVEKKYKWPIGQWSSDPRMQDIGKWNRDFWEHGMEGWAMANGTRHLGWSVEKVRALLRETKKAIYNRKTHVYYELTIVYARKPLEST
ncbi:hypothetical protein FQN55_006469 [Onygenales sp. PD_40]|nr:hypothetical protein FQN55_006469 [Onygenales sp. PD_40]